MNDMKLTEMEREWVINSFKYILEGKQKCYPYGMWHEPKGELYFQECIRYYYEDVLHEPVENFKYVNIVAIAKKLKLQNALKVLFNRKGVLAIFSVLPHVKIWEINTRLMEWTEELQHECAIWLLEEKLGLTEDTVLDIIDIEEFKIDEYKNIYVKFRSISKLINCAYPNLNLDTIKRKIRSLTTVKTMSSFYGNTVDKKELENIKMEYRENIKIYKKESNTYYTNTGCEINIIKSNSRTRKSPRTLISHPDRKPTYDEIKYIRYELLNKYTKTYLLDIDEYSNKVTLYENKTIVEYKNESPVVKKGTLEINGETLTLLITVDGGVQMHMSVSSLRKRYIDLEELLNIRRNELPMDKEFGMYFPPVTEFINLHSNCFHLLEIL